MIKQERKKLTFYRAVARARPPAPWPFDRVLIRRSIVSPRSPKPRLFFCNSPVVSRQSFLQLGNNRGFQSLSGLESERLDLGAGGWARWRKALGHQALSTLVATTTCSGSAMASEDSSRYDSEIGSFCNKDLVSEIRKRFGGEVCFSNRV